MDSRNANMSPRNRNPARSPNQSPVTPGAQMHWMPDGTTAQTRSQRSQSNPPSVSSLPQILTHRPQADKILPDRSADFDKSQDSDSDAISLHSTMSNTANNLSWVNTTVGDLVSLEKLVSTDENTNVENAFDILSSNDLTCLPLSHNDSVHDYFDYADLTGYLLLVLGHITVKGEQRPEFETMLRKAREGNPAPVGFASRFGGGRDPFVRMSAHSTLASALEKFASGVHRIAVTSSSTGEVIGILSQRRLVRYIWNNLRKFPHLDAALESTLEEKQVGTYGDVVSVNGDAPVLDALDILHEKAVSSVAVVDSNRNLLGNISVVDVSLLTRAWQASLLSSSCKHFLTVVLDHRGIAEGGNESVPVFYVYPSTTLAKVMATLVATRAHRLWICEPSPDPALSGRLIGVISITDVLNFISRQSGQMLDPETARRHRRSSSSSVRSNSRVRHSVLSDSPHGLGRPRLSFDRHRR